MVVRGHLDTNISSINNFTKKIELPICILNIGGISNIIIKKNVGTSGIFSKDIGPGNCLIDFWVRKISNKKFDQDGILASNGKTNE